MNLKKNIAIAFLLFPTLINFNGETKASNFKNLPFKSSNNLYAFLNNSYSWKDNKGNKYVINKEDCSCSIFTSYTESFGINLSPGIAERQRQLAEENRRSPRKYHATCQLSGTKFTSTGFKYKFNGGTSCNEDDHFCRAVNKFGLFQTYQKEANRLNSEEKDRQRAFRSGINQPNNSYRELKKPVRWEDYEKKAQGYGQYRIAHKRACSKMLRNPLRMIASNFSIDGESCKQYLNKNSGEKFDFLK